MLKQEQGFTLVELLVATVVAGIMISAISGLFLLVSRTQVQSNRVLLATQVAENKIESLRNNHYNSIPLSPPTLDFSDELPDELPEPREATVEVTEPQTGLKRLDVTISWREGTIDRNVKLSTMISNTGIAQ